MKLFYNPAFTGGAYVDFSKSPVLFDAKLVNTAGLCKVLRLHEGLRSCEKDYGARFVDYYAAMKKFMEKNPGNVFVVLKNFLMTNVRAKNFGSLLRRFVVAVRCLSLSLLFLLITRIFVLQGKAGIELDTSDDSFEIWNFAERDEAVKYLSLLDAEDFDVWINADNKEFDNWQKLEGKRLSGSKISGIPHTAPAFEYCPYNF